MKKMLVSLLVGISMVGLVGCGKQETKENITKQEIISLDKTIKDIDVNGKRVLVRCDFNVPLDKETGEITNDLRIKAAIPTIQYL